MSDLQLWFQHPHSNEEGGPTFVLDCCSWWIQGQIQERWVNFQLVSTHFPTLTVVNSHSTMRTISKSQLRTITLDIIQVNDPNSRTKLGKRNCICKYCLYHLWTAGQLFIVTCTSVIKSQLSTCNCSIPFIPEVIAHCPPYSTEAHLYSATWRW